MDPLEARNLIPLSDRYIHMNHAGVSPMSQRCGAAIEQVVEACMNRPYRAGWSQEEADHVRELVAQLISGSADGVALTRSTAHGISFVAQGLDWKSGDNVVGATWEYPANVYPWMALASEGVEFRQAKPAGGRISPDAIFSWSTPARAWWRCRTSSSGMAFASTSRPSAPNAGVAASCSPST